MHESAARYLTSVLLSAAVAGAKHSGSDQVAVGEDAGLLADQPDVHLLQHGAGAACRGPGSKVNREFTS